MHELILLGSSCCDVVTSPSPRDLSVIFEAREQEQSDCSTAEDVRKRQDLEMIEPSARDIACERNIPYMVQADELFYFQVCASDYTSSAPSSGQSTQLSVRETCDSNVQQRSDAPNESANECTKKRSLEGLSIPRHNSRSHSGSYECVLQGFTKHSEFPDRRSMTISRKDISSSIALFDKITTTRGAQRRMKAQYSSPDPVDTLPFEPRVNTDGASLRPRANTNSIATVMSTDAQPISWHNTNRATTAPVTSLDLMKMLDDQCALCQIKPASTNLQKFVESELGWSRASDNARQHCALGDSSPICSTCFLDFISIDRTVLTSISHGDGITALDPTHTEKHRSIDNSSRTTDTSGESTIRAMAGAAMCQALCGPVIPKIVSDLELWMESKHEPNGPVVRCIEVTSCTNNCSSMVNRVSGGDTLKIAVAQDSMLKAQGSIEQFLEDIIEAVIVV